MADKKSKSKDSKSKHSNDKSRVVYQEFGNTSQPDALERATPDLPPNQQQVRVQATRSGRKGKTVTLITGFQTRPDTLTALLKQLKAQCGAGGTVKEDAIEIQGDHRDKILQTLLKLGYKAKISGG
jgi:translation initiation factor 1